MAETRVGPVPLGRRDAATAALVGFVAFLPFLRGLLRGSSFYFRDLSHAFFPVRRFAVEGLRAGQLRYWNPFAYEGVPLSPPPIAYPPDLLQVLRPDEAFFSLLLALHMVLAALAAYLLARRIGASPAGAAAGGLTFALGGFALSTVNLYVYCEALPWVALLPLALARAAEGGRRQVAWAAVAGGLLLSTTALESAIVAFLVGIVLALPLSRAGAVRVAASALLAAGLAAVVLGPASALVAGSARGGGFPTEVVLAHSVHPVALLQVVVAGLFGDTSRLAERFWGMNFFPRGFPYVLSLYLGATALGLAGAGAASGRRPAGRLVALLVLAVAVSMGLWAGLAPLVDALGWLRKVRYPVKAFLAAHLATALLVALGVDAIATARRRPLRLFAALALAGGLSLAAAPLVVSRLPGLRAALLRAFFPPGLPWPARLADAGEIARDAASGGAVAVLAGLIALAALRGRVRPGVAAWAATLLLGADLLRAGAGLNPMVAPELVKPSAEAQALAVRLRATGSRVMPLDPSYSPAYFAARQLRREHHELWSFALLADTLSPDTNLGPGVQTALTPDRTMLVPSDRVLPPEAAGPASLPALLPRLREAGVGHVLSLDALPPIDGVKLEESIAPARLWPLAVHVYSVDGAQPLAEARSASGGAGRVLSFERLGDTVEIEVELPQGHGTLVWRESHAPGWRARLDGRPVPVGIVEDRHIALPVPAGRHLAVLSYHPPRLRWGALVSAIALLAVVALVVAPRAAATGTPA